MSLIASVAYNFCKVFEFSLDMNLNFEVLYSTKMQNIVYFIHSINLSAY